MPPRTYMEQLELKSRVDALRALQPHLSIRAACLHCGVNHASYLRWCKVVEAGGPRAAARKGRPAKWTWTPEHVRVLKWFLKETESWPLAVEYFVRYAETGASPLPGCPWPRPVGDLAGMIHAEMRRGGRWDARLPKPLYAAARLTDAERRSLRGPKQYNDAALSTRRLMVIRDINPATGLIEELAMWAGCGFCSDDVSPEQPFVSEGGADGERVNRQTLVTVDVYSLRGLGLTALARPGDAYTKVDQADHIAAIVAENGLPYYWSFERGPWQNDFIDGVRVADGWTEDGARWGGLDGLFKVRHKFKPQHKVIEGWLHHWQRRMRGRALTLRSLKRGENERATRLVTAAQRGNEEAIRYLWSIGEFADAGHEQMQERNATAQRREFLDGAHAVPDELWAQTYKRRDLLPSDAWRLLPVKVCRVMVKQRVSVSLEGYGRFDFACVSRGELPLMDNGHRLLVAFHPGRPEAGAHIFNGDLRGQYNHDGAKFGEFLGVARYLPPAVMEDFTGTGDFSAAARARQAVQSELRLCRAGAAGVVRVSRRADNMGRVLRMGNVPDNETAPPVPAPTRAPRVRSLTDLLPRDHAADAPRFSPPVTPDGQPLRHSRLAGRDEETGGELISTGADPWAEIS